MNKFTTNVKAILAKLGMTEKAKKKELSDDDRKSIAAAYKEEFGTDLDADADAARETEARAKAMKTIEETLDALYPSEENEPEDPGKTATKVVAAMKENQELRKQLNTAKSDAPEAVVNQNINVLGGEHTRTHLYGIAHPMFSMEKRWNQIARFGRKPQEDATASDEKEFRAEFEKFNESLCARYRELKSRGLVSDHKLGTITYSDIANDTELGTAFMVRREDALIARIVALPTLNAIFPLRSNIQDGEVITNAFFGEFSQPYEAGEVSKGSADFKPEKARVSDVMFKYLIASFKWIETNYLGYLNTSGSDPIKWNMIEWLVLSIATKLQSERNLRAIQGYHVPATTGSARKANFSAFGLLHTLIRYYEGHRVLPFKGSSYIYASSSDIGDVLVAFVEKLAETVDNPEQYAIYVNAKHKAWYRAWYNAKFGSNANYQGDVMQVPYHDNPIVWVPNMGNSKFIIASVPGNLQQLENVPGEMTKIDFEKHLESVWAFSVWKEGFSAAFSGKPYSSASDLAAAGGKDQMVFMNWPEKAVTADATTIDANVSGNTDNLFITGVNTAATALTDITNAKEGVIYRIEIGDDTYPTKIAKSGKFSDISAAWNPSDEGEFIKVYYNGSKFIDVERG